MSEKKENKKVYGKEFVTPPLSICFPHLFKKQTYQGKETGYSVGMIIPKTNKELLAAIVGPVKEAGIKKWGPGFKITDLANLYKKGDEEVKKQEKKKKELGDKYSDEKLQNYKNVYEGNLVFTARTSKDLTAEPDENGKPRIRDTKGNAITNPRELYTGAVARLIIIPFVYEREEKVIVKEGGKKIEEVEIQRCAGFYINKLQKLADGKDLFPSTASGQDFDEDGIAGYDYETKSNGGGKLTAADRFEDEDEDEDMRTSTSTETEDEMFEEDELGV